MRLQGLEASVGYIATLDVLGFSDMLYRDGYATKLKEYIACIDEALESAEDSTECVLFSDSIVLTSSAEDDNEEEAFGKLLRTCSATQFALIQKGIPVRGAIAYGTFWRKSHNGSIFLAGRPIVEAYSLEKSMKWVGTMLTASVLHKLPMVRNKCKIPNETSFRSEIQHDLDGSWELAYRLQPVTAPFDDSSGSGSVEGFGVVPVTASASGFKSARSNVSAALNRLRGMRAQVPHPVVQAKYASTIKWLSLVSKRFDEAAKTEQAIRAELRES